MTIKVSLLRPLAVAPVRGTAAAAGLDLFCYESGSLKPGERALFPTGFAVELPEGTYGRIAPRSSLSKRGIDVLAGVVDRDYRGEVMVMLLNASPNDFHVESGDRIAQLICEKCVIEDVEVVSVLAETERGAGGFGSTGK